MVWPIFVFDERIVSIVSVLRVDVTEMRAKKRDLPDDFICPVCKHPASDFELVE